MVSPTSEIKEEQKQHKVESFGLGCQKSCVQPGIHCEDQVRQRDSEMTDNKSSELLCTFYVHILW